MTHLNSADISKEVYTIEPLVRRLTHAYASYKVLHSETVSVGGKREWGSLNHYTGSEIYHLVVDFTQEHPNSVHVKKYELVKDLNEYQKNLGMTIEEANKNFQIENKHIWATDISKVESIEQGFIAPFQVNDKRMGEYAIYHTSLNDISKLVSIVTVKTQVELFKMFDNAKRFATNFSLQEMVTLGYLTVADHTSWLGAEGSHVHAVVAYFRKISGGLRYFSLETWCGGNNWKSQEHSPNPAYPTSDTVTCKKCLAIIEKRQAVVQRTPTTKSNASKTTKPVTPAKVDTKKVPDAEIFAEAKALGVTWKEHTHAGINRMRAIMAIKAHKSSFPVKG